MWPLKVNNYSVHVYIILLQLLLIVPLSTALCDFGYTLYQGAGGGSVAPYQYLTPLFLAVTMVRYGGADCYSVANAIANLSTDLKQIYVANSTVIIMLIMHG